MNAQKIYLRLRLGGLSAAGACGLMGNMRAESTMRANNAQDSYGYDTESEDIQYTAGVDIGHIDFVGDKVGYGLCQWTLASRKQKLLAFARSRGVSIGDEMMQVDFCLKELREDFPGLFAYLCSTKGVYEAAERVCKEYERPAINNVAERAAVADSFYQRFGGISIDAPVQEDDTWATTPAETEKPAEGGACGITWPPRTLQQGMNGFEVALLQTMLEAHGYGDRLGEFGKRTESMVRDFQKDIGLAVDGIAGPKTWAALLNRG